MGSEEVTLLISLSIFRQLRSYRHKLVLHTLTHIYKNTHIDQSSGAPREKWSGGVPSKHPQPPILFIAFCQSQQQNGRSRKKIGRKKRRKKEYRLAFRAPRGPLSSIRNERAAKHQPCSPPHPPTRLSRVLCPWRERYNGPLRGSEGGK